MNKVPMFTLSGIKTIGRVVDIYDGDTMTCIFPIFGDNYFRFNLRLMGIDTPELKSKDTIIKEKALEARHKIMSVCCNNKYNLGIDCKRDDIRRYLEENEINVWIECLDFDKYGRILANIYPKRDDNMEVNSLTKILLDANLGYEYDGGKKKC
jgi:endonuclease YncB( thermonuclease family)